VPGVARWAPGRSGDSAGRRVATHGCAFEADMRQIHCGWWRVRNSAPAAIVSRETRGAVFVATRAGVQECLSSDAALSSVDVATWAEPGRSLTSTTGAYTLTGRARLFRVGPPGRLDCRAAHLRSHQHVPRRVSSTESASLGTKSVVPAMHDRMLAGTVDRPVPWSGPPA
jgi:hypothetical protein